MTAQQRIVQGLVDAPGSKSAQWAMLAAQAFGSSPIGLDDLVRRLGVRYHAARAWCVRAESYGWGVYRDSHFHFSDDFLAFSAWLGA